MLDNIHCDMSNRFLVSLEWYLPRVTTITRYLRACGNTQQEKSIEYGMVTKATHTVFEE